MWSVTCAAAREYPPRSAQVQEAANDGAGRTETETAPRARLRRELLNRRLALPMRRSAVTRPGLRPGWSGMCYAFGRRTLTGSSVQQARANSLLPPVPPAAQGAGNSPACRANEVPPGGRCPQGRAPPRRMLYRSRAHWSRSLPCRPHRRELEEERCPCAAGLEAHHGTDHQAVIWYISWCLMTV